MKCPKCEASLRVVHTYDCEDNGRVQRRECANPRCGAVVVSHTQVRILAVDPQFGRGAISLAREMGFRPSRQPTT